MAPTILLRERGASRGSGGGAGAGRGREPRGAPRAVDGRRARASGRRGRAAHERALVGRRAGRGAAIAKWLQRRGRRARASAPARGARPPLRPPPAALCAVAATGHCPPPCLWLQMAPTPPVSLGRLSALYTAPPPPRAGAARAAERGDPRRHGGRAGVGRADLWPRRAARARGRHPGVPRQRAGASTVRSRPNRWSHFAIAPESLEPFCDCARPLRPGARGARFAAARGAALRMPRARQVSSRAGRRRASAQRAARGRGGGVREWRRSGRGRGRGGGGGAGGAGARGGGGRGR